MTQFYFLSVLFNLVGGAIFTSSYLEGKISIFGKVTEFFNERSNLKLFLGLITGIVGIMKLLLPVQGIAVLGDLLPALAGCLVGFGLIIDYYHGRTDVADDNNISTLIEKYRHIIGLSAMGIAVLHFFVPGALFL